MTDFIFNLTPGDIVYDIETYPNVFTLYAVHSQTKQEWVFEFSNRKNDIKLFKQFIDILHRLKCRMVGFNNINFDYPVIHHIYQNSKMITMKNIYDKAMSIINSYDDRFSHIIWDDQQLVSQVDLFKIHHFDNKAKSTSLKVLEFNMRSTTVENLPFPVGTHLNTNQIEMLITYNKHDVLETLKFYELTLDKIRFREELSKKYNKSFINHNDTKIGKDYFIMKLEEHKPGSCYRRINGRQKIVQTHREFINLNDVILPIVHFNHTEFRRILSFFKSKTIQETNGVFKDVNCTIQGFTFDFGTGGIHGSVENRIVLVNSDYIIEDWDVASYYPNLAIVNEFYPQHLGKEFCKIYKEVYQQRKSYPKGTSENAMLKLALNGVYGDSNNEYSPFYDPQYTMSITVNGQLLLCMLAETLLNCFDVELIQINTDGLTIKYPKKLKTWVHSVTKWWESFTKLTLESVEYSRMFIRDVNNYIAEYTSGSVKRKGAYEYDLEMYKNHSALVVAKAAEACLLNGTNIKSFIENHEDIMDFMLRTKLPRTHNLEWGGEPVQNVSRYYVSTEGDILEKIMPAGGPLGQFKRKNGLLENEYQSILKEVGINWDERIHTKNKSVYEERRSGIHPKWTVQVCNDIRGCTFADINYDFYSQEAEKLVKPLKGDLK